MEWAHQQFPLIWVFCPWLQREWQHNRKERLKRHLGTNQERLQSYWGLASPLAVAFNSVFPRSRDFARSRKLLIVMCRLTLVCSCPKFESKLEWPECTCQMSLHPSLLLSMLKTFEGSKVLLLESVHCLLSILPLGMGQCWPFKPRRDLNIHLRRKLCQGSRCLLLSCQVLGQFGGSKFSLVLRFAWQ